MSCGVVSTWLSFSEELLVLQSCRKHREAEDDEEKKTTELEVGTMSRE